MALNSTIYKFNIALSDLNRHCYESFALTVARHPSETAARMMVRVLAYCLHYAEGLEFTKGLSTPESPDLWRHALDSTVVEWIEVGEPSPEKIKKACRQAKRVFVYSFNSKSNVWWEQEAKKLSEYSASVRQFNWQEVEKLAAIISRNNDFTVNISENSFYITSDQGACELTLRELKE